MSITLSITGHKSLLESYYHPPLSIGDKYECGLLYFSSINSVPNINASNNTFSYGEEGRQLQIPCGIYDLYDIGNYLESNLADCEIKIEPNNNTLKCLLFCSKTVHFDINNSIGQLLGFRRTKLEANKWHESETPVNILPLSLIRVECDLIHGAYTNGSASHIIHEFVPNVPPGHQYIEVPRNIIYFPINKSNISSITIRIINERGHLIDFKEENIQLRLHLRRAR